MLENIMTLKSRSEFMHDLYIPKSTDLLWSFCR